MTSDSIGGRFDTTPNALNAVRLALACQVVAWHAYRLRGDTWMPGWLERFSGDIAVDAFFAISGFLIVRAWMRQPDLFRYLTARAARILPGLWACLLVTAFVVAPALTAVTPAGQWGYVLAGADTWSPWFGIDGGPIGVPHPGTWNGSLWSLGYETACYLAVALLGMARLLRPAVVAGIAATCWAASVVLTAADFPLMGHPVWLVPRCGLMFACGALLYHHRHRLPYTRAWVAASAVVVAVSLAAPNYRLVAAPAVAYLALAVALWAGRYRRLRLTNDLSYGVYVYGFVAQQALLLAGVNLGWAAFTVVSLVVVLPAAAASWWLVEKPALRLAKRRPVGAVTARDVIVTVSPPSAAPAVTATPS